MRYVYLNKKDLGEFVDHLKKKYKVVAPVVKENQFVFAEVENADEISLEHIPTILPPKKYFFPQKEKLGSFNMGETKMSATTLELEATIIFGAHTCDIDGMECLEAVFHHDPADPYYNSRESSIVVFGYECMKPCDENATCVTMDTHVPKAGYDVMMTDAGDKYILHLNSNVGEKIVGTCSAITKTEDDVKSILRKLRESKMKDFKEQIDVDYGDIQEMFKRTYNSAVWEDIGKKCVSCGNCTAVCPTCYCFDVYDEVKLDVTGGERKRVWDSCQLEDFASVAGGENFREERSSRQRHRLFRKFEYPVTKYNKFFCTGCGRCTRTCMAQIKLVETLNALKKEKGNV